MGAWATGRNLGIRELRISNHSLNDPLALRRTMERDGYLFFRDALDLGAIARLRAAYVKELRALGVVDPGDEAGLYNGRDGLQNIPPFPHALPGLNDSAPWRSFVAERAVADLFGKLLGSKPYWVPIVGYRVQAPREDISRDRFSFVHQDGFFNEGINFINCWIPLCDIDEDTGGMAIAEACHTRVFHDKSAPPKYSVPINAIPRDAWRRTDFKPGDLLMLHLFTPHTGITNISKDKFRLSLDIRTLPSDGEVPAIGKIESIDLNEVRVRDDDGTVHRFTIDDDTYVRGFDSPRLDRSTIPQQFHVDDLVIISHREEHATVLRPAFN